MVAKKIELVAIVGPTASGKTSLAIAIAKEFNGEIIAVDSRTIYKGLDIGTAKPTKTQQAEVKHWGLDIVDPTEAYSAAQFKKYAKAAIKDIVSRGKLPIMVGGTGLYMDGVLYNFSFAEPDNALREELGAKTVEELQAMIVAQGIPMPINKQNKIHLVTALERKGEPVKRKKLRKGATIVGLNPDRQALKRIVTTRATQMIEDGVLGEIKRASNNYGWDAPGMTAGIYKVMKPVIEGTMTENEGLKKVVSSDMQLAKRQMTWLKRNPDIEWFIDSRPAKKWLTDRLSE
jgi:tRNA dimethylallyltransferase